MNADQILDRMVSVGSAAERNHVSLRRVLFSYFIESLGRRGVPDVTFTKAELRKELEAVWREKHPEFGGKFFPLHRLHSSLNAMVAFRDEFAAVGFSIRGNSSSISLTVSGTRK